jgi:hypothetical protein
MTQIIQINEDTEGGVVISTSDKYAVADIAISVVEKIQPHVLTNLKAAITNFDMDNYLSVRALDAARDELANTELLIAKLSPDEAKQIANSIYVHLAFRMAGAE